MNLILQLFLKYYDSMAHHPIFLYYFIDYKKQSKLQSNYES